MYLHAFAVTRDRFDYYVFAEDDYVPAASGFDWTLQRMYDALFGKHRRCMDPFMPYCEGSSAGVMAGILQGQPVEAESTRALHLERSHIMSAYSLTHIFHHVYSV